MIIKSFFAFALVFLGLFAAGAAHAQVCTSAGQECDFPSGAKGTCQNKEDGFVCQPTAAASAGTSGNSSGLTTPGSGGQSGDTKGPIVTLLNPLGAGTNLAKLVNDILGFVVRVGAIVVTFMLIYVGYKFVVARGDPGKITEAKQNLLWTIVGALILLGAQAIAMGIEQTVRALSGGG